MPADAEPRSAQLPTHHKRPASERSDAFSARLWRRALGPSVPAALSILVSINSLWNEFASDDESQILNNELIKTLSNLPKQFVGGGWAFMSGDISFTADSYFRPLFTALLTINHAIFGVEPWGWHLTNVIIHGCVTALVFLVIREITEQKRTALIAASLFAVHPIHSESVAWVSGATDPLMSMFVLSAFYFYLRYRKRSSWGFLALAVLLFFFGLLSKETALGLLLVIAYCEIFWVTGARSLRQRIIKLAWLGGLFLLPTAIYFLMRAHALGSPLFSGNARNPLGPILKTIPLVVLKYLWLAFVPYGYNFQHYTAPVQSVTNITFLVPLLLLVLMTAAIAWMRSRTLTVAFIWFAAMLAPALGVLRQLEPAYLVQERYLYLPSVGACLVIALGIEWLAERKYFVARETIVAATVTSALVLALGAICVRQNMYWRDSITLYRRCVSVNPYSPASHTVLSRVYFDAGRPRDAEAESRTALQLDGNDLTAYMNLSYYARSSGKLDNAIEYLEQSVSTVSENPMTRHDLATVYLNLGLLYQQQKAIGQAEANMLKSVVLSPRPSAWYYLGQFYTEQNRYDEALSMFEKTAADVPQWFFPIHLRLGMVYEKLGRLEEAKAEYGRFLEVAPAASPDVKDVQAHLLQLQGKEQKP